MNWDQIFSISWCKEVSLCFPHVNAALVELQGDEANEQRKSDREEDLDIRWVLGLSTGPEVMEMGVCCYGTPRAPTLRYHSSYYPECTCQGIDNHSGFYQTAAAAPISLLDG